MPRRRKNTIDHEAQLRAMDAQLGKVRRPVLEREGSTPIRQGEAVRVKGIGTQRPHRFEEVVYGLDEAGNVRHASAWVKDVLTKQGTKAYRAVRPEQLTRIRNQEAYR